MSLFRRDQHSSSGADEELIERDADLERLTMAQHIALESLKEDHHALEIDAKLAFGPAATLAQ